VANALYIHLSRAPYARGHDLDPERRIGFDAEGRPLGVELLNVRDGVNLSGLPQRHRIALLLDRLRIPAIA